MVLIYYFCLRCYRFCILFNNFIRIISFTFFKCFSTIFDSFQQIAGLFNIVGCVENCGGTFSSPLLQFLVKLESALRTFSN